MVGGLESWFGSCEILSVPRSEVEGKISNSLQVRDWTVGVEVEKEESMNKNLRSGTKKDMKPPELFVAS
jgi:hypothetical protein